MSKHRLFSSKQVERALRRAGFSKARTNGSHASYVRSKPDGSGHYLVVVQMDKHEIPSGTLNSILQQANLTYEQFLEFARVRRKGS